MNQPASSSSFSLDPVADRGESKSSSSLTSKLRRRLRASTTTNRSHGDLVSEGSGGGGGGGAVGLTTLRNSKSSTNLLLGSLGRKARPSGGGGGGRARANTGSSKSSPKTRAPHEFHDPSLPPRPPQMLPFDLTPLLITPMITNIPPTRTVAAQTSDGKKKLARKSTTWAETPNDSTRHLHENGLLEDPKRKRDASIEEEVLAAAGTSEAHDDFGAPVQRRQDTFSISENSMSRPSESDQQPASSGTSSDVTAPSSSKNNSPDRDRSSTRSPSERRPKSSPRRPVPEPLRTRAAWGELPPLRADSDESIISYASIQK